MSSASKFTTDLLKRGIEDLDNRMREMGKEIDKLAEQRRHLVFTFSFIKKNEMPANVAKPKGKE